MVKKVSRWKELLIRPEASIVKAIEIIDKIGLQIALVVDENCKLQGTVTDGDIRRGLLKGISLEGPVSQIMNSSPVVANPSMSRGEILKLLESRTLRQIPIVDSGKTVIGISVIEELLGKQTFNNPVVLMAGGVGKRLYPLTKDTPKPMLKVGSKPILETILENFVAQGFKNFYLSVNFKSEVVKDHFGDGSKFGAEIRYLEEETGLGTAGSLGLMPEKPTLPMIVMNGDLLTKVNFVQLLDFHQEQEAVATMCLREYDFQVPYGVVSLDQTHQLIQGIDEKPIHKFFVNGGIYVLNPEIVAKVRRGEHMDMTTLFSKLIEEKRPLGAFPVREYWIDIGRLDDFEKANNAAEGI